MKFLTAIALLAATAIAGPVARAPEQEFHLKTAGAKHKHHNNLFVYAYHTGAGLNDAVLDKDASIASPIYLNGTKAQANLQTEFPWGLVAVPNTNYACTSFARIESSIFDLSVLIFAALQRGSLSRSMPVKPVTVSRFRTAISSGRSRMGLVAGLVSALLQIERSCWRRFSPEADCVD